jgi:hypothetical protein
MPKQVTRIDEGRFLDSMKKYPAVRQDFDGFDAFMGWTENAINRIRSDESYLRGVRRMDAGEAAFFARQLEFIKAKTYDVLYPEYKAQRLIPVSTEAGPGADSITFRQFNVVGQMVFIGQNARDLPRVDTYGKEFNTAIKSFGNSYGYTIQEVRRAMFANIPLEQRKANAARLAYEQLINRIAWLADGSADYAGIYGMFYNGDVTSGASATGIPWLASDGATWNDAITPDQVINDVNAAINSIPVLTKDVEHADTVLMSVGMLSALATKPRSSLSDTTVLQFLKANYPGVTFEAINEAAAVSPKPSTPTVSASSANLLIAYARNPDKITLEIPQPFEQFPVQEVGLEYEVNCHARCAGVISYYPLAVNIVEVPVT